jgi:site-specific DNA-methyltransferase (adenine-specific)
VSGPYAPAVEHGSATLYGADCLDWLAAQPENSFHACVTDPPYGMVEYSPSQQAKLRAGRGGVWRIPPSFDGHRRSPLPRFTTLTHADIVLLRQSFVDWGTAVQRVLVPGAHLLIASQPLVADVVSAGLREAGLEPRGAVIRLIQTLRGGDRPKNAHDEFPGVTVMPRSQWEPWLLFRKAPEGRVADNLRKWRTGGLRRLNAAQPFGDVISSGRASLAERRIANHPSLKPQAFLRPVVRAMLPLGEGVVLDPFAGSGSTLAAAEAVGYESVGIEVDPAYVDLARSAIAGLARLNV